jgi:hypothetical protein
MAAGSVKKCGMEGIEGKLEMNNGGGRGGKELRGKELRGKNAPARGHPSRRQL